MCEVVAFDRSGGGGAKRTALGAWPPNAVEMMRLIELAVETDYWYFELFGDLQEAADYAVILYGAVSDLYMRDVDVRITITYVRLESTRCRGLATPLRYPPRCRAVPFRRSQCCGVRQRGLVRLGPVQQSRNDQAVAIGSGNSQFVSLGSPCNRARVGP